jgi:hypothetical protein
MIGGSQIYPTREAAMKRWKIAISIAVVGAVAGPFILGTYKMRPTHDVAAAPLSADQRERIEQELQHTNNCEDIRDRNHLRQYLCREDKKDLETGFTHVEEFNTGVYLAWNAVAASGGFIGGYILTFLLYTLANMARIYWRWLHE